ncbi:hypothetical protein BDZ91DRAFT_768661 [Kalaharituber pfeilii]|nr:hypothetical protein BDZ91DRAFT_768661 [Kalaharituber pfeilii]
MPDSTINRPRLDVHTAIDYTGPSTTVTPVDIANYKSQFVPGAGIDQHIFGDFILYQFGAGKADWRPAVNVEDGKEGYILRCAAIIRPSFDPQETIQLLKQQTSNYRNALRRQTEGRYFEKLHQTWEQHQQYLADAALRPEASTQTIDRNLPVPFLDLPPSYDEIESLSYRRRLQLQIHNQPQQGQRTRFAAGDSRPRPVSCSDMDLFSPTGGFYPDGYNRSLAENEGSPLTSSRVNEPPMLPEILPILLEPSHNPAPTQTGTRPHRLRQSRSVGSFNLTGQSQNDQSRPRPSNRNSYSGLAFGPIDNLCVPTFESFLPEPSQHASRSPNTTRENKDKKNYYADGLPLWA